MSLDFSHYSSFFLLFPERKESAQGFLSLEPRQDYVHSVCPYMLPEILHTARKMFTILALSLLCCYSIAHHESYFLLIYLIVFMNILFNFKSKSPANITIYYVFTDHLKKQNLIMVKQCFNLHTYMYMHVYLHCCSDNNKWEHDSKIWLFGGRDCLYSDTFDHWCIMIIKPTMSTDNSHYHLLMIISTSGSSTTNYKYSDTNSNTTFH